MGQISITNLDRGNTPTKGLTETPLDSQSFPFAVAGQLVGGISQTGGQPVKGKLEIELIDTNGNSVARIKGQDALNFDLNGSGATGDQGNSSDTLLSYFVDATDFPAAGNGKLVVEFSGHVESNEMISHSAAATGGGGSGFSCVESGAGRSVWEYSIEVGA